MINKEIAKMLNEQINLELHSGYLYMEFANYYEDNNLPGFAHWYMVQAAEEHEHAMKIRKFLIDAGHRVSFKKIDGPDVNFKSPKDPLVEGLKHEQFITRSIYDIYEKALELKDYLSVEFLRWFVEEQGEEETNAQGNIDKFELCGNATFMLDKEMGVREA
ncbi:MAG: ferritin [Christensenellales bacterium]|jgi:ferritin